MLHAHKTLALDGPSARFVVVADTHGRPHPKLDARLAALAPAHVLHAGDVGDVAVLRVLERRAPVTAVRGNVDGLGLPDVVTLSIEQGERTPVTILLTHIGLAGTQLRADVMRLARAEDATLVVCGHSHVPFAGTDRGVAVFNPGSVGPRRFSLPIVLGVMELGAGGVELRHVDCETGLRWIPGAPAPG